MSSQNPAHATMDDLLQAMVFGAVVASREFRKDVDCELFWDEDLAAAVSELQTGSVHSSFQYLRRALEKVGVVWDPTQQPLEAVLARFILTSQFLRAMGRVVFEIDKAGMGAADDYRIGFLEALAQPANFIRNLRPTDSDSKDDEGTGIPSDSSG